MFNPSQFQKYAKTLSVNKPLTGSEINEYLKNVPGYQGLFIRSQLDKDFFSGLKNGFYILNYGKVFEGTHWVAFEVNGNKITYFSSLGDKPLKIFDTIPQQVVYSNYKLQSNYSMNCGLWAVAFIKWRSLGRSLKDFANLFIPHDSEKLLLENDRVMLSLLRKEL